MSTTYAQLRALLLLAIFLGGSLAVLVFETNASAQEITRPPLSPAQRKRRQQQQQKKQTRSPQTTPATVTAPTRNNAASSSSQPIRVPQITQQPKPTPTPARASTPAPQQTPQPAPSPSAQAEPAQKADNIEEDDEVIRVTSNLVVVPVSVTNERGEPVQGLKATDFRLEEEGRAQEVAQVGDADQVPLDIAILFDASSSIGERFAFEQEAAARFLKQVLKPIDRAAVFVIEGKPRLEQQLAAAEIASAKLLRISAPTKSTPTAFYDTTTSAARYLAQNAPGRNRRVIVVISDGDDNFSERVKEGEVEDARALNRGEKLPTNALARQGVTHRKALLEVQREVQRADAVFYSINPSGGGLKFNARGTRAQAGMQQLADTTGGTSFTPEQLTELDEIFRRIAAELRAQYLLQYYSNSDAPNGKFLSIKVRTPARAEARVRARSGYYAKK